MQTPKRQQIKKARIIRSPRVTDKQLLDAFASMCNKLGIVSRGFDVKAITAPIDGDKHDGTKQWAMNKAECGWMVVCGKGGCGAALSRWNGYVRTRWDFLMLLEAVSWAYASNKKEK